MNSMNAEILQPLRNPPNRVKNFNSVIMKVGEIQLSNDCNPVLELPNGVVVRRDIMQEIVSYMQTGDLTKLEHTLVHKYDVTQNEVKIMLIPIVESG